MGKKAYAPACLPLSLSSPLLLELQKHLRQRGTNSAGQRLIERLNTKQSTRERFECLLMEKVEGHSYVSMKKLSRRNLVSASSFKSLFNEMILNKRVQRGMGETFAYDLILGNFDRFTLGLHESNIRLNVAFMQSGSSRNPLLPYTISSEYPVIDIDQTLSAFGMYLMLRSFTDSGVIVKFSYHTDEEIQRINYLLHNSKKHPKEYYIASRQLTETLKIRVRSYIQDFLESSQPGAVKQIGLLPLTQTIVSNLQGTGNIRFVDLGFMETLLRLKNNRHLLRSIRMAHFGSFQDEANTFFSAWQGIIDVVQEFDENELTLLVSKLSNSYDQSPERHPQGTEALTIHPENETEAQSETLPDKSPWGLLPAPPIGWSGYRGTHLYSVLESNAFFVRSTDHTPFRLATEYIFHGNPEMLSEKHRTVEQRVKQSASQIFPAEPAPPQVGTEQAGLNRRSFERKLQTSVYLGLLGSNLIKGLKIPKKDIGELVYRGSESMNKLGQDPPFWRDTPDHRWILLQDRETETTREKIARKEPVPHEEEAIVSAFPMVRGQSQEELGEHAPMLVEFFLDYYTETAGSLPERTSMPIFRVPCEPGKMFSNHQMQLFQRAVLMSHIAAPYALVRTNLSIHPKAPIQFPFSNHTIEIEAQRL